MNPVTRAHRILSHLSSFEAAPLPVSEDRLPSRQPGEKIIGIYWNKPRQIGDSVLFSDQRVCVRESSEWRCIHYSVIRHERVDPSDKLTAEGVMLTTETLEFHVPIRGKHANQRDAFEVLRYFKRVREDLAGRAHPSELGQLKAR
jgi:hypothetical protein